LSIIRKQTSVGKGITFTELIDNSKKTSTIAVSFLTELTAENAAVNALVPMILTHSSKAYPTMTALNCRLSTLYGASLSYAAGAVADNHDLMVRISTIADKYALEGENLTLSAAQLLCGCIFEPNFSEDDFDLLKGELIDNIDSTLNDKHLFASVSAAKTIFKGESSAVYPYGDRESASAVTPDSAYSAYKRLLSGAAIEVCCYGREISPQAKQCLISAFSALGNREGVYVPTAEPSPLKSSPAFSEDKLDVVQSKLLLAYKSHEPDSAAMRLFSGIFGGTPFSLLFTNVREKMSLCYYCSARYRPLKQTLIVNSGVEHTNISTAREAIGQQLERICSGDFTNELVEQTKLYYCDAYRQIGDSPNNLFSWYHSMAVSGKIVSPEEMIERTAAVTREDIIRCAKSFALDTVYVLTASSSEEE